MGSLQVRGFHSAIDRKHYLNQLFKDYQALEYMLAHDWFENDRQRIGVEQELCLIDHNGRPASKSLEVLKQVNDNHLTTELALFNLELNLDPLDLESGCFTKLEANLNHLLKKVGQGAANVETRVLLSGILPSLRRSDLTVNNITPFKRYLTLNDVLTSIRGNEFKLRIKGVDELVVKHDSIMFEACNTSFQIHLQIDPAEIIDQYNWAQAIAGPVLSVVSNSPFLLGKELWSETRIALFQQSIDLRNSSYHSREQKARVSFGHGWLTNSVLDYYKDDIVRYSPILTREFNEDSALKISEKKIPKLEALNLFNGTIYKWNRLCYGITDHKPHFRIENRYIPSGPTVIDEMANLVFWIGLMVGMPKSYRNLEEKGPFEAVKSNFVKAARNGLNSYFNWFGKGIAAKDLVLNELIPIAKMGLLKKNFNLDEIEYYLNIIRDRVLHHQTGSIWMVSNLRAFKKYYTKDLANTHLSQMIYKLQALNKPVHTWPPDILEWQKPQFSVRHQLAKFMTTEVFVVNQNDLVILAKKIIDWKKLHHVPVVDDENHVVGMISSTNLESLNREALYQKSAKELMSTPVITISSQATVKQAKRLMKQHKINSILVVDHEDLVGIITKTDLIKFNL